MKRSALMPVAIGATLVLSLAGCAKDGAQSGSSAADDQYAPGPLDEYMSVLWEGEDWSVDKAKEQDRQREDLIAQCMAKEGFEYIPDTSRYGYSDGSEEVDGPEWGTLEFAEQYGYGIVDWPGREEMMNQDPEEHSDPNQAYVESLSESEQTAFYETLYGKGPTEEEMELIEAGEMEYEWSWETSGCDGWAMHELESDSAYGLYDDPEFEDLMTAMQDMWTDMFSDSEYQALNQEWASCMADSGFSGLTDKDTVMNTLYDKYNELMNSANGDGEEWVEPDKALTDEFQKQEIAQAVADYKCSEKVNYNKRSTEIQHRMQQEFLDQNKTQLDAAIAKYATKDS
ncbi:MAG: hypothetical protein WAS54_02125 [Scrofimicrobium sp.]